MMAGHRKETPGKRDRSFGAAKGSRVQSGPLKSMYGSRSTRSAAPLPMTSDPEERPPTSTRAKLKLDFSEVRGDLFSCPRAASLVHCVSEDMAMGRGIAKEFKKQFGGIQELKGQGVCGNIYTREVCGFYAGMFIGVKTGGVAVLKRGDRYIFYLVSKQACSHSLKSILCLGALSYRLPSHATSTSQHMIPYTVHW